MDATNDPIVEALKKAFQEHGLEVSDPNQEDPIGTIFRAMLKDEVATQWVIVIYDVARQRVELQVASLKEENGQTHTEDENVFAIFNLPTGNRLNYALDAIAHEAYSWLDFAENSDEDEDGDDGDDEDDVENPEEDGSDEEEKGDGSYQDGESWKPKAEREPGINDWFGTTD